MTNDTKNLAELKRDFHKIYYSDIAPLMNEYEKKRKALFVKFTLVLFLMVIIFLLMLYFCMAYIFLYIFVLYFGSLYLGDLNKNFTAEFKNACMTKIMNAFGIMNWYPEESKLSDTKLRKSELFSGFNTREDDDVFVGKYKGVKFIVSETKLSEVAGSGRDRVTHGVFDGVIIDFASNKDISNTTIVSTKGDMDIQNRSLVFFTIALIFIPGIIQNSFFWVRVLSIGFVAVLLICGIAVNLTNKKKSKLNRVMLEDVEFNKQYNVYSSDEIEARYLLTTAFMDRFKNLQTSFEAYNAKCSFYGKSVMFAITSCKDLFELGNLFTPLNGTEHMQVFFNELISILAMIDYFKLNEKSGL